MKIPEKLKSYLLSANKILKKLKQIKSSRPDAIALSVQVGSGSFIQTRTLVDALRTLSLQNT